MRIISGSAGGIPLEVPKTVTRPTQDRVRQALFSMIGEVVQGAQVLDLFSGTGAFGLECLSRGAESVMMVEGNRQACEVIKRNAAKTRLTTGATVRQGDVFRVVEQLSAEGKTFDLIFADPPYAHTANDEDLTAKLLAQEDLPALLKPDGNLILESLFSKRQATNWPGWQVLTDRTYGSTRIVWLSHSTPTTNNSDRPTD
ncbi:MAG: 16S rRNA (guanine(966)-N(2))-methyltransferase RsmD [Prosthecobacter sp.]